MISLLNKCYLLSRELVLKKIDVCFESDAPPQNLNLHLYKNTQKILEMRSKRTPRIIWDILK